LSSRVQLVGRISDLMRRTSTLGLLIHQSIAEQIGLHSTDLKFLDAVRDEPQLTAGRLSEITGLSTSATSAALDRLERRGFIRRVHDEQRDRRRVFVVSTGQHEAETARLFEPLSAASTAVLDNYDDKQLTLIADFLERLNTANEQLMHAQARAR
jgi:DNA-binding MarR family transcriptional regulator